VNWGRGRPGACMCRHQALGRADQRFASLWLLMGHCSRQGPRSSKSEARRKAAKTQRGHVLGDHCCASAHHRSGHGHAAARKNLQNPRASQSSRGPQAPRATPQQARNSTDERGTQCTQQKPGIRGASAGQCSSLPCRRGPFYCDNIGHLSLRQR